MMSGMGINRTVLSVDLEFFEHTPAFRRAHGNLDESGIGRRGVEFLLTEFQKAEVSATFFIVGEIADKDPDFIRRVAANDHEIGSHTYNHRLLSDIDNEIVSEELVQSREILHRASGQSVHGFRAPAFEIPEGHFAALQQAGYKYDSSVMPSRRIPGWYGGKFSTMRPVQANKLVFEAPENLYELPVSVMPFLRLPITGAWMRFFGLHYTILGMHALAERGIAPVLYVHPWEFVDLPAVDGIPKRVYWRTGSWMCRALKRILKEPFKFTTAEAEIEKFASTE